MLLTNSWIYLRKGWHPNQLGLLLFFRREILFIFRRKGYTSVHIIANTLGIRNWVHTKLCLKWVSTLISCCCLSDVDFTLCFIVIYCLMRLRPPLFDLVKWRSKVIMRNMQLILSRLSKLIIGQEREVLTCKFWLILCLLTFLSGCYLSKLTIANNCLFFFNSEKLNVFSLVKDYLEFVAKYPMRNIVVHK